MLADRLGASCGTLVVIRLIESELTTLQSLPAAQISATAAWNMLANGEVHSYPGADYRPGVAWLNMRKACFGPSVRREAGACCRNPAIEWRPSAQGVARTPLAYFPHGAI